jgi:transketolase
MPNLAVYRPCDAIETAECWELALSDRTRPSVLALTRQNLPQLRTDCSGNRSAGGGYRLRAATAPRRVVLVATGSEVALAVQSAALLEARGIGTDVVSMPCVERWLEAGDPGLVPAEALAVSIEAGATLGWERVVGRDGLMIGIDRFGASAPAADLFRHFGFTPDAVVERTIRKLG